MFAVNNKAEMEGIEFRFGAVNEDGSEPVFKLARLGPANKRYKAMISKETKPLMTQINNDALPDEVSEEITLRVFCSTVLIGWRDLVLPEVFGSADRVEYSAENATKLMKSLPELYSILRAEAAKMSNFRDAVVSSDTKN